MDGGGGRPPFLFSFFFSTCILYTTPTRGVDEIHIFRHSRVQKPRSWKQHVCVFEYALHNPAPGRSQSAPLKVHKSWMFWPVITRPPAFQACRVPDSDRQPSSLGLKQTLWNVLMGRELILGLNLSGSSVPP